MTSTTSHPPSSTFDALRNRWAAPSGYREVLQRAIPLIISTGTFSVQQFVNRIFLSQYSQTSLAASMPAGMACFTLVAFFIGTAAYATSFVAQYFGAKEYRRIGPAVWQAIYFACLAGILLPLAAPLAGPLFRWAGHAPEVQREEYLYFKIVMIGGFFPIYSNAVSAFFTGLARNWIVMVGNVMVTALNIVLDYCLIFGHWGFPEWGIEGAAWASNIAVAVGSLFFTVLMFRKKNEQHFAVRSGWRFDRALFMRLLRFGVPSGGHFMLDISAFTLFMLFVGRIGTNELSATNIAFQINSIAFMPMIGFGIAVSTLVGQRLGENEPALAAKSVWSAFHIAVSYMGAISLCYVVAPSVFIAPFIPSQHAADFAPVIVMVKRLLYFVAAYCMLDTLNIIFASALKGAGDTRFVMLVSVTMAWTLMVVPTWVACTYYKSGLYTAWFFLSAFVMTLGFAFLARFLQGKWKAMRIIETPS